MAKGFFVPNSMSSSYVANKRNESGSLAYDDAATQIGIQSQQAFAALNDQYSSVINNAYNAYLMGNRAISGSSMGQGYKEAYLAAQQEGLAGQVAEANLTAANMRGQIQSREAELQESLQQSFASEVQNYDRVGQLFQQYNEYLRGVHNDEENYWNDEQMTQSADALYQNLSNAQFGIDSGWLDADGNRAMSYLEYVNAQMKDTQADTRWKQWFFGMGGYQSFLSSVLKPKEPTVGSKIKPYQMNDLIYQNSTLDPRNPNLT
jgi:hypothetical protein